MLVSSGRSIGTLAATAWWLLFIGAPCAAAPLEISVRSEHGEPLASVAVFLTPIGGEASPKTAALGAVMDQRDQRFDPHLLVVQAGTSVSFPNNDAVSHHVYSFSPAKVFELGLYKGSAYPPVLFDTAGLVVVGCNIHDGMLGYILVVDTPHFTLSGADGVARVDLPPGDYALEVWTPRARPAGLPAAQRIAVSDSSETSIQVQIAGRLAPPHDADGSSLSWRRY